MKSTEFHPADYDAHGRLRLPFSLLVRAAAAGAHTGSVCDCRFFREQGNTLLNLFYPDHDAFWLGLLPGVPAVLAFLLSGRRFAFPVVWRWLRGLLILAQLVLLCWQPVMWLAGDPVNGVGLALLVADVVALIWLLTNQRLRACFSLEKE